MAEVQTAEPVARMVRFNELMDLYGGLLTERQRRFATMRYAEDMSFGEIAGETGVSRQAVHDAVKHAGMTLDKLESHLGLLDRETTANAAPDLEPARRRLADLRRQLLDTDGAVAPPERIAAEIDAVLELL